MKNTEFRIGNYYNQFGNIEQVSWSVLKKLEDAPKGQLWCKPIPLTEEWLLKFGFEKEYDKFMFSKDKLTILIREHDTFNPNGRVYWNSWTIKECQPEYVHQLQNLYFALTGEELTFKSE